MEQKNRVQDIQQVFDRTWKANNYSQNGVMDRIDNEKQRMNRIMGLNKNERTPQRINEQKQKLENIQRTMNATSNMNFNNNFRN